MIDVTRLRTRRKRAISTHQFDSIAMGSITTLMLILFVLAFFG